MTIDARGCRDLERALSLEWLESNGRGGYASGTLSWIFGVVNFG